ncbi:MAG: hypothetical protein MUP98_19520, partial [Candidatus Aminicenantes bacterium]|nr:hypothetical protein [Candidatus Aminicenantes bacterium]
MFIKKLFLSFLILICLSSWAAPQSLVELAKKEKERREKTEQINPIVIRNVDLIKKKRTPAVGPLTNEKSVSTETDSVINIEDETIEPQESEAENPNEINEINEINEETLAKLEEIWNSSEEYASLLSLKIRALLQEFYGTGDTKVKEDIQRQMNEISQQLEKAK